MSAHSRPPARNRADAQRRAQEDDHVPETQDGRLLTMAEVEERIMRADDELADLTIQHMTLADRAANAEADWKAHRDRVILKAKDAEERTAADTREAMARGEVDPVTQRRGSDLYRSYKVAEAAADSSARAMRAIEARLNAFQTIAANLRRVSM